MKKKKHHFKTSVTSRKKKASVFSKTIAGLKHKVINTRSTMRKSSVTSCIVTKIKKTKNQELCIHSSVLSFKSFQQSLTQMASRSISQSRS